MLAALNWAVAASTCNQPPDVGIDVIPLPSNFASTASPSANEGSDSAPGPLISPSGLAQSYSSAAELGQLVAVESGVSAEDVAWMPLLKPVQYPAGTPVTLAEVAMGSKKRGSGAVDGELASHSWAKKTAGETEGLMLTPSLTNTIHFASWGGDNSTATQLFRRSCGGRCWWATIASTSSAVKTVRLHGRVGSVWVSGVQQRTAAATQSMQKGSKGATAGSLATDAALLLPPVGSASHLAALDRFLLAALLVLGRETADGSGAVSMRQLANRIPGGKAIGIPTLQKRVEKLTSRHPTVFRYLQEDVTDPDGGGVVLTTLPVHLRFDSFVSQGDVQHVASLGLAVDSLTTRLSGCQATVVKSVAQLWKKGLQTAEPEVRSAAMRTVAALHECVGLLSGGQSVVVPMWGVVSRLASDEDRQAFLAAAATCMNWTASGSRGPTAAQRKQAAATVIRITRMAIDNHALGLQTSDPRRSLQHGREAGQSGREQQAGDAFTAPIAGKVKPSAAEDAPEFGDFDDAMQSTVDNTFESLLSEMIHDGDLDAGPSVVVAPSGEPDALNASSVAAVPLATDSMFAEATPFAPARVPKKIRHVKRETGEVVWITNPIEVQRLWKEHKQAASAAPVFVGSSGPSAMPGILGGNDGNRRGTPEPDRYGLSSDANPRGGNRPGARTASPVLEGGPTTITLNTKTRRGRQTPTVSSNLFPGMAQEDVHQDAEALAMDRIVSGRSRRGRPITEVIAEVLDEAAQQPGASDVLASITGMSRRKPRTLHQQLQDEVAFKWDSLDAFRDGAASAVESLLEMNPLLQVSADIFLETVDRIIKLRKNDAAEDELLGKRARR